MQKIVNIVNIEILSKNIKWLHATQNAENFD